MSSSDDDWLARPSALHSGERPRPSTQRAVVPHSGDDLQPADRRLGHLERDDQHVPEQHDLQPADRRLGHLERSASSVAVVLHSGDGVAAVVPHDGKRGSEWSERMHEAKHRRKLESELAVVQRKLDEFGPPADIEEPYISDSLLLQVAYPLGCPSVTEQALHQNLSRRHVRRVHSSAALIFFAGAGVGNASST